VRRLAAIAAAGLVVTLVVGLPLALPAGSAGPGDRALATIRLIASGGPRPAGSAPEARAARIASTRLRSLGYRVVEQPIALPDGGRSRNVVARTAGPARVVVAAHVDGVRAGPAANDNASGVGVMLELAAALRGTPGIVLAVTGAEERVETGSRTHLGAARLLRSFGPTDRRSIRLAVALDMVGYGTQLTVRGLEPTPNAAAARLLAAARRVGIDAVYLRDRGESDHAELSRAGIPAAWVEWREDPCWHAACDRAGRIDPDLLAGAYHVTLAAVRATPAR
jgi:hypothetical protein